MLVIYREFWYFSRIFPTLFSQLISIFMSLLHTFSMGVKTMRDFPGANGSPLLCVVAFFPPPAARAGVLEPLQKWEWSRFEHYEFVDLFQPRGSAHFFNGCNTPALTGGWRRTPLRIMHSCQPIQKVFRDKPTRAKFYGHAP